MAFSANDRVIVNLTRQSGRILTDKTRLEGGHTYHYVAVGEVELPMWVKQADLSSYYPTVPQPLFTRTASPHILVVDNFLKDPDAVRQFALGQVFVANEQRYKGKRTAERFLWPGLKEEFERLLNWQISNWTTLDTNGCFQVTGHQDPIVWHHDNQNYAAAIHLTPSAPVGAGTSFWRFKPNGCRRPASHPSESHRFSSDEQRDKAMESVYTLDSILKPDPWELVDKVGSVYNRLVMWDSKLFHSASSYEGLAGETPSSSRLIQLFFFD